MVGPAARHVFILGIAALAAAPAMAQLPSHGTPVAARFLDATFATTSVLVGREAYVFGGYNEMAGISSHHIARFDLDTSAIDLLPTDLPFGMAWSSSVWTGTYAYIFAGNIEDDQGRFLADKVNAIVRFDPATGETVEMGARLPTQTIEDWGPENVWGSTAVWDGTHAYIFGGPRDEVFRYDPVADVAEVVPDVSISAAFSLGSIFDGHDAYVFGTGSGITGITRFTPATGTAVVATARFSEVRWYTSAVWTGQEAFVFGGFGPLGVALGNESPVFRFDPKADAIEELPLRLPGAHPGATAVWDGEDAFILGGSCMCTPSLATDGMVSRFTP